MTSQDLNQTYNKINIQCGIIIIPNQDDVVFFDQNAANLLKMGGVDSISRTSVSEFLQIPIHNIKNSLESEVYVKNVSVNSGKETHLFRLELTPLIDGNAHKNGRILKILDITPLQQLKTQLDRAIEDTKIADIVKESFFNTINHEIRTPLGAIIGMSNLLRDTPLNSEQLELVETIITNSDDLLSIIKNILEFSKIENGEIKLNNQPFDLRDSLETTFKPFIAAAGVKELDFNYDISQSTPNIFYGDPIRLQQILVNLTNNAIKYTDHGEINISITNKPLDSKRIELQFSIQDTGIGIPETAIKHLFQPFNQADNYKTRKYGGTGLGLAIAKKLCEQMKGRIWVMSEMEQGSTFFFTIVLEKSEHAPKRYLQPQSISLRGKRLLIIAQNAEHRRVLSRETRSAGMSPYVASSLSEVTYWLKRASYDFAILDTKLLDNQTEDLIAHIVGLTSKLPIILLGPEETNNLHVKNPHVSALINLPIVTSNLYDIFINTLAMRKNGIDKNNATAPHDKLNEMGKRHPLKLLMVEDNPINQKVARRLLQRLGYELDIAQNGIEGVQAVHQNLYDVIFMDIQMPIMDGLEATKKIRQNIEKSKQPRIIAVTAHAMDGDREEYIDAGMDDYISKPMKIDALVAALHKCKPHIS